MYRINICFEPLRYFLINMYRLNTICKFQYIDILMAIQRENFIL